MGTMRKDQPPMRDRVWPVAERIPKGHWLSYGDIAAYIGSHARPVSTCMATYPIPNAHRILRSDGSLSPGFKWVEERTDDPIELLESEGLRFVYGRADPNRRWQP
jgi:alkylated DNA nucleotide flippase Atl1